MHKSKFFKIFLMMIMFMYLVIAGGCGGGGGGGGGSTQPIAPLSNLQISVGSLPAFNPATTRYAVSVTNDVASVTITPATTSGNTIAVNGTSVTSGSASGAINLDVGSNTITIVVSSSAGSTTYTVTVTRAAVPDPAPTLTNLQLSAGTLSPVFNAATIQYTASVANTVTSVAITPTTASTNASITVNGIDVSSGSASGAVNLNVGPNAVAIVVSNSAGSTSYTVTVTRANVAPDPIPTLSNLQISAGTLTPAFSAATTQYTASVVNTVTSITVTPTTTSVNASISVNGVNVNSGSASEALNLNVGSNTINIVVSNAAGSASYTVTVTRAAAPDPVPTLSNLQVSSGTLTPTFNAATLLYTASVANTVTSVTVTPATTTNATITVNGVNVASGSASGALNLNVGSNTITIVASNTAGSTSYTVTVTRASQGAVYHKIDAVQALIMMANSSSYVLLDVRTELEFKELRIKDKIPAILIPYDEILSRAATELPDKNQFIFVYCKAGVRSKWASDYLVGLGYTNVYDIGGIDDWPYEKISDYPPTTYWIDEADEPWWNATDTSITVSTPQQFATIAKLSIEGTTFSGKTITLKNDIDLAGIDWATTGSFEGVFDGGGNSILNMFINSSGSAVGLFGYLGVGGIIKNIALKDMEIFICPA
jgi:rhodanese-related sulfurtransferase/predicted Rdx family selenoprotein